MYRQLKFLSKDKLPRIVLVAAVLYIPAQVLFGYLNCADNFCPGDREEDYVYSIKDEDGKTWYMEDGKPISESDYKEAHKTLFEFKERIDNEPQR